MHGFTRVLSQRAHPEQSAAMLSTGQPNRLAQWRAFTATAPVRQNIETVGLIFHEVCVKRSTYKHHLVKLLGHLRGVRSTVRWQRGWERTEDIDWHAPRTLRTLRGSARVAQYHETTGADGADHQRLMLLVMVYASLCPEEAAFVTPRRVALAHMLNSASGPTMSQR
eukprot:3420004-Amphidinium_carterae.1